MVTALAAGILLLTGCGGTATTAGTDTGAEPQAAGSATASTSSPAPGIADGSPDAAGADRSPVPETLRFRARTMDGSTFDGSSLAGKPVLLWFWAPWCPTCRSQIPQVRDLAARFEGRARVVGVGGLDDAEAIAGFAKDVPGITHLTDPEGTVWRHFGVIEQSSFVLLDDDGAEVFTAGYGGASDLGDRVAALLG